MAIGDRIKRMRNFRKMTMKELGMAVGFDESSADVRIAQYENNSRAPKEELLRKIAKALNVNYRNLYEPAPRSLEDIMYTLFELEEHHPSMRLLDVVDNTDEDFPEERISICFRNRTFESFLKEWQLRRRQLDSGEITKEEYIEWKANWPQTADDCGKFEPSIPWRKNK